MECISLFIFVREYYRGSVGRGCFVYFILEVGEIWKVGEWVLKLFISSQKYITTSVFAMVCV